MIKFNFYYSFAFWLSFVAIVLLSRALSGRSKIRFLFLFGASCLMLLAIPGFSLGHLIALLGLSSLVYVLGHLLNGDTTVVKKPQRMFLLVIGIVGVLAFLASFKYRFLQEFLSSRLSPRTPEPAVFLRFIGVSYFSFKLIHFLVESFRKKIEKADLVSFYNFIVFFPSFISGPINRYNHFSAQLLARGHTLGKRDLATGAERIVNGIFKKFVLVPIFFPYVLGHQGQNLGRLSFLELMLGLYAYAFYFYFDFSGYSDLAIGSARLLGFALPENFNNPFIKRNIRELWTNWHISLTGWLVDYIYWPLVRKLRDREYFRLHPILLSNLGMIITFILCGMWHGETVNFIIWGAYHGLGISALTIYQRKKRGIKSASIQKYFRSSASHIVGSVLTFNYFALGLVFFVLDFDRIKIVANGLFSGF